MEATKRPLRVLLDNAVLTDSEFAEEAVQRVPVRSGSITTSLDLHGLVRKAPDKNNEYEQQRQALFTVGRLIRENRLEAYHYVETIFERMRGNGSIGAFNALEGCKIRECPPALERSKFRRTVNFRDTISKGGKDDRKAGMKLGNANQIAFLGWLCELRPEHVELLIAHAQQIQLTEFEVESLRDIQRFKFLCLRSQSSENYPDVFHLWTAERNGLDAVLTMESKLPNLVSRVRKEKVKRFDIRTEVLRPLDLLARLGIDKPDPVPIEAARFYHWHDV